MIFLAACDSEFASEIFLKCQAKHVICIKKNKHVLDDAAIMFTKSFYKLLFEGKSVCKAFSQAKQDVDLNFGEKEASIFSIFVKMPKNSR